MLIKKLKAKHDALANTKLPPEEVAKLLKKGPSWLTFDRGSRRK